MGAGVLVTALLVFLAAGIVCHNGKTAGADDISPRDAAIEKAEAWEKKRYADILKQTEIKVYGFRRVREFPH
jgi:hypothetical protein